MADVIGGFFGTKGKKLTFGLTITGAVARRHISNSTRTKLTVKNEFANAKKNLEINHDIEKGQLNQEKLAEDAGKFIAASSKIFFYDALILRRELHEIEDLAKYVVEIEKVLEKAGKTKDVNRLKKLDRKLIQEIIFEEAQEGSELKALFGLERQAKGKGGVEFFFKTHKFETIVSYMRKFSMRTEFKHVARDEKRIENNVGIVKEDLEKIKSGKVKLDKEAHIVEQKIDIIIDEVHDELKNSHRLVFNNWMNLQFVLGIINGDIKMTDEELKEFKIPVSLGHLDIQHLNKVLAQANANLREEQTMLNQIYREAKGTEKDLRRAE